MRRRFLSVCLCLLISFTASAAVSVGDKPKLQFKSFGPKGEIISLEKLRGKIVVIDFWATWCGPCMAEAEHMVRLNEEYGPKGLQMIGISLDQSGAAMASVCREKNFNWPQHFDGRGWKNAIAADWGVNSIPRTFLISPEGEILWSGHPARIDPEIEKAFKEHPPRLVDERTMAAATEALDKADAAIADSAYVEAFKAMANFPAAATQDEKIGARFAEVQKSLETAADAMLAEIDPMIASGQFADAAMRLREIAESLDASPVASKAKLKLADLQKNPDAKAAIDAAEQAKRAANALALAQKLQAEKKDEQAYVAFKALVKNYPNTEAGQSATVAVAAYEKDPAFVKRANEKEFGGKAKSMLSLAANYKTAGKPDLAKKKYQEVIEQFPDTSFAETAKSELAKMK